MDMDIFALLLPHRREFISFAASRLRHADAAADVVQDCLVKALQAGNAPVQETGAKAWFYRILRRAIIDLHRRQQARDRAMKSLQQEMQAQLPAATSSSSAPSPCRCVLKLVKALPLEDATLLQRVDMDGDSATQVALSLGLRVNTLNVRLYRARRKLRLELEVTCKNCATNEGGCLDCQCAA